MIRGIRGAIDVDENSREAILTATSKLLKEIISRNEIDTEKICSIFITATPDLNAEFPAYAVRENGLVRVPVLCAVEIGVPSGMKSLIRMLIHLNTDRGQTEVRHVYLGAAAKLRPDLAGDEQS
jgi:chorismate mutase